MKDKVTIKFNFPRLFSSFSLMALIICYWIDVVLKQVEKKLGFVSKFRKGINRLFDVFDPPTKPLTISRLSLIDLAIKNMKQKKTRTMITVGGMTIGIAAIVFLLSIGYGLQNLVVGRVARLEEMRQLDVSIPPGSNLTINEDNLKEMARINNVDSVSPIIALVAKASYQNSATDLVAFGVTRDYLEQSAIKPVKGEIFTHNEITNDRLKATTSQNTQVDDGEEEEAEVLVEVIMEEGEWLAVRDNPGSNAKLLGYTKNLGSAVSATEITGKEYVKDSEAIDRWYKIEVPLWSQDGNTYSKSLDESGTQISRAGYIADINILVEKDGEILHTDSPNTIKTTKVDIAKDVSNQVVVNRSALRVLGLNEEEAVGKEFDLSFVATGELLSQKDEKIQSTNINYKIIGVTPDDNSPVIYVPLTDLRMIGIDNFSQVKVSVNHESKLSKVRETVENFGYNTNSVNDTVSQINSLFATARTMLAVLGLIALTVASLGMFNTLTVSLLERTHEVGLMKAMGLKSSEIQDLFLAESLILGSSGGFCGLIFGFLMAKLVELIVSVYAISKGVGYISMVSIPLLFILVIIALSFIVGWITGIYPARRSKRISALNALRYE